VTEAILEIDGLEVRYGAVPAVRGVDLRVARGEIVGLIGPNGAGKSSTLHAVMGAVPTHAGEMRLRGRSITGLRPEDIVRAGVALVPEGRHIFGELTVEENLGLGLVGRRERNGHDRDLAWIRGLFPVVEEFRGRPAGALSGGQQQQLAIARALASDPKVLLLDEPTEGIQPSIIKDIARLLRDIRSMRDICIVVCEQVLSFVLDVADRLLVMENGRIVHTDTRQNVDETAIARFLAV
jgi:urea transport system ATP-binding protein